MKYWMLLIFFLLFAINAQANFLALPNDYQIVGKKINTISSTTSGFVNINNQSSNTLESQYIKKQHFSMLAFLLLLIIGVLYLQHKEDSFSEQLKSA